jgi:hypothetical protein
MAHLIEQLQTECPIEFGSEKKQINKTAAGMKQKYENAMSAVFIIPCNPNSGSEF